jgi:hypothetical protein
MNMTLQEARKLKLGDVIYRDGQEAEVTAIGQQQITIEWSAYGSCAWLSWADLETFQMEKSR